MSRLRRFRDGEDGSMVVEGMLAVLLLMGWFVVAFQFFQGYRVKTLNTRAAGVVLDIVAREKTTIGPKYVEELGRLHAYLVDARGASWVRVTGYQPDAATGQLNLLYSYATGGRPAHTVTSLRAESGRIPRIGAGETGVLLETSMNFDPIFDIARFRVVFGNHEVGFGMASDIWISNFVYSKPINTPKIVWNASY